MRTTVWDQYEFEFPDSEESLELVVSSPRHYRHRTFMSFMAEMFSKSETAAIPPPAPFRQFHFFDHTLQMLRGMAGLDVSAAGEWPCHIEIDEDFELRIALDAGEVFYCVHWATTA